MSRESSPNAISVTTLIQPSSRPRVDEVLHERGLGTAARARSRCAAERRPSARAERDEDETDRAGDPRAVGHADPRAGCENAVFSAASGYSAVADGFGERATNRSQERVEVADLDPETESAPSSGARCPSSSTSCAASRPALRARRAHAPPRRASRGRSGRARESRISRRRAASSRCSASLRGAASASRSRRARRARAGACLRRGRVGSGPGAPTPA